VMGRSHGLRAGRRAESLDLGRSTNRTVTPHHFSGCYDHSVAAWRPAARTDCRRERNFFRHVGARAVGAGDLGSHRIAILHQLPVFGHRRGDGL